MKNIYSLLWNTLVVYILYTLCRLAFLIMNWELYSEGMSWGHGIGLFAAGIIFDTSAIIYTNIIFLVLFMLPLHYKENAVYYKVVKWVYVVINSICMVANLCDCVYFPYTGKRTTGSVLAEFGHEGAGMAKIIWEQVTDNWFLLLLAFAMGYFLYRLFRPGMQQKPAKLCHYYGIQTGVLALCIPLCIAGMRGGFTMATRPITISNANQYVESPKEAGLVLNTPFSLIRTFNKKPLVTPNYMSEQEAEQLFTPVQMPADSAQFRPMNVVVLIMESFGMQHIGFYNHGKGRTPFLDTLLPHALTFKYAFANGRKSIEGMPSVLSSLPNYVEPFFLTPASLNNLSGLARELGENKGYTSAFFHGAQNGSMGFEAFAKATGFQQYYGRTEYNQDKNYHGDDDFDGTWAIWDEEFLQFYADCMSRMQQPFVTSVFTASSHSPFAIPERYKGKFKESEDPIEPCIEYTDNALRLFFEKCSKQPWYNNTLFVITADHTSHHTQPYYQTTMGNYLVPVVFYAPGHPELCGYDTQRIVQQIDIMPTVLAFLGYDKPYIGFGQNLLTPNEGIALHWVPESNGYEYLEGNYALEFDGEHTTHAYRFRTDSLLKQNILNTLPQDTLQGMEKKMKSVIQQYMKRMNENKLVVGDEF